MRTRLAAVIAELLASRGACAACGDAFEPHDHYRTGWECTRPGCKCGRYQRLPLRQRIADAITASGKTQLEMAALRGSMDAEGLLKVIPRQEGPR